MKEILIFAGTTEGRILSERLAEAGLPHRVCVATEYGELVMKEGGIKEQSLVKVHKGRMSKEEIAAYIETGNFGAVVDATHPYAGLITQNIKDALKDREIPYLRLKRENTFSEGYEKIRYFESSAACAGALEKLEGNILLTTGSKELGAFCVSEQLRERLFVRVLPGLESLKLCMEQGILGKQILALQGPFTAQMNEAILQQYGIKCLVTKESGETGGYPEKLEAAGKMGIPVYVISRPVEEEGESFAGVCRRLEALFGKPIEWRGDFEIVLAGVGMGGVNTLTKEVSRAVEEADIIMGAPRLIENCHPTEAKKPFYQAEEMISYLEMLQSRVWDKPVKKVVILFSGDTGFYSGCNKVYQALERATAHSQLRGKIRVLPGISSVSYLASCMKVSYQDGVLCSMHGRELCNLAGKIRREKKLFLLMSGRKDMNRLGELLVREGLCDCTVTVGYQLSYPEQWVRVLSPKECMECCQEGLYVCCIQNPEAKKKRLTHGWRDEVFLRDKVPMTKEEIREVSICKLKLYEGAVVYDIGSGTGSIAVEIAGLSDDIRVYAVEQREEAVCLIRRNRERFGLENMEIIQAKAPEGLEELPMATHAFLGGSGGNLKEILTVLYRQNPRMRIVINAVTLETLEAVREALTMFPVENEDMIQMQVNRVKTAGAYHMMQAQNPVWICAFEFAG